MWLLSLEYRGLSCEWYLPLLLITIWLVLACALGRITFIARTCPLLHNPKGSRCSSTLIFESTILKFLLYHLAKAWSTRASNRERHPRMGSPSKCNNFPISFLDIRCPGYREASAVACSWYHSTLQKALRDFLLITGVRSVFEVLVRFDLVEERRGLAPAVNTWQPRSISYTTVPMDANRLLRQSPSLEAMSHLYGFMAHSPSVPGTIASLRYNIF